MWVKCKYHVLKNLVKSECDDNFRVNMRNVSTSWIIYDKIVNEYYICLRVIGEEGFFIYALFKTKLLAEHELKRLVDNN